MDTMLGDTPTSLPIGTCVKPPCESSPASWVGNSRKPGSGAQYGSGLKRQLIDIAEKASDRGHKPQPVVGIVCGQTS